MEQSNTLLEARLPGVLNDQQKASVHERVGGHARQLCQDLIPKLQSGVELNCKFSFS
jgi:hypothetical protein